ncbi:hypothetical protein [Endozoicomonas sp. SCSIO W0465]|uniref:hypothetical protein n=1 Tax=Endozoicomonas sp. SCSIO W0465 TaxID=2918516 RepID=UPI00207647D4|nr:hypothetical protein [Endozoicomonas sp. SCSIO W0465]USE36636.1 hypothetical protein MJO57_32305 [Endozoicomonas sp. SCSIO W0465]
MELKKPGYKKQELLKIVELRNETTISQEERIDLLMRERELALDIKAAPLGLEGNIIKAITDLIIFEESIDELALENVNSDSADNG